jgi:hypothetical protein
MVCIDTFWEKPKTFVKIVLFAIYDTAAVRNISLSIRLLTVSN